MYFLDFTQGDDFMRVWKSETIMKWQIGSVGKAARIQWWLLLLLSSNPTGGNFFFILIKNLDVNFVQKCQICVENEKHEFPGVVILSDPPFLGPPSGPL